MYIKYTFILNLVAFLEDQNMETYWVFITSRLIGQSGNSYPISSIFRHKNVATKRVLNDNLVFAYLVTQGSTIIIAIFSEIFHVLI